MFIRVLMALAKSLITNSRFGAGPVLPTYSERAKVKTFGIGRIIVATVVYTQSLKKSAPRDTFVLFSW